MALVQMDRPEIEALFENKATIVKRLTTRERTIGENGIWYKRE